MTRRPTPATSRDDLEQLLAVSPRQEIAAAVLAGGGTQQEAADAVKVARETISRWRRHPGFVAALNRHRASTAQDFANRLDQLRALALDVVETALKDGDVRAALRILELLGTSVAYGGSTDAREVFDQEVRHLSMNLLPLPPIRDALGLRDTIAEMQRPSDQERARDIAFERLRATRDTNE